MSARYIQGFDDVSKIQSLPNHLGIGVVDNQLWAKTPGGELIPITEARTRGTTYYVYGNTGSDSNNGKSRATPFRTMDAAFDVLESGDTIVLSGNIREQLNTPAGVFDVRIIGDGNNTRHPDAHTTNGGYVPARWNAPASPTATTPLLSIRQQGWQIENVLFTGLSASTVDCIQLYRDGGSGDDERDAGHTRILNCRFQGGRYGVVGSGGVARVEIKGCEFMLFSSSGDRAITTVVGAGIGTNWGWKIHNNTFLANLTDIDADLDNGQVMFNHFVLTGLGVTNTVAINTSGGVSGFNVISKNWMYSASNATGVNARFVLGTADSYAGNYWNDVEEYAEPAE